MDLFYTLSLLFLVQQFQFASTTFTWIIPPEGYHFTGGQPTTLLWKPADDSMISLSLTCTQDSNINNVIIISKEYMCSLNHMNTFKLLSTIQGNILNIGAYTWTVPTRLPPYYDYVVTITNMSDPSDSTTTPETFPISQSSQSIDTWSTSFTTATPIPTLADSSSSFSTTTEPAVGTTATTSSAATFPISNAPLPPVPIPQTTPSPSLPTSSPSSPSSPSSSSSSSSALLQNFTPFPSTSPPSSQATPRATNSPSAPANISATHGLSTSQKEAIIIPLSVTSFFIALASSLRYFFSIPLNICCCLPALNTPNPLPLLCSCLFPLFSAAPTQISNLFTASTAAATRKCNSILRRARAKAMRPLNRVFSPLVRPLLPIARAAEAVEETTAEAEKAVATVGEAETAADTVVENTVALTTEVEAEAEAEAQTVSERAEEQTQTALSDTFANWPDAITGLVNDENGNGNSTGNAKKGSAGGKPRQQQQQQQQTKSRPSPAAPKRSK